MKRRARFGFQYDRGHVFGLWQADERWDQFRNAPLVRLLEASEWIDAGRESAGVCLIHGHEHAIAQSARASLSYDHR